MLRRIALCLALAATPALAQQRPPQRAQPQPAAAPGSPLDIPVGTFQQRFNDTARRIGLPIRAVEGECQTNTRRQCRYSFGRVQGMLASLRGSQTLDDVGFVIPGDDPLAIVDGTAALTTLMMMFAPNADNEERRAVIARLTSSREATVDARLGNVRFSNIAAPGIGSMYVASRPD